MRRFFRGLTTALLLLTAVTVAACGDKEAEQRKAFVAFLQTRIVDKPGLHVPQLTPDERTSFGPYADQYAVITGFHDTMNKQVAPQIAETFSKGSFQSIGDLVTRRDDIAAARTMLNNLGGALDGALATADSSHAALKQPDDVKPVFDQAYDRTISQVATTFRGVVPVTDKVFGEALDLADYIDAHKKSITLSGPMPQVSDAKVLAELNGKLQTLQKDQVAVQQAYLTFSRLISGAGQ
jgi:hypothetical protein